MRKIGAIVLLIGVLCILGYSAFFIYNNPEFGIAEKSITGHVAANVGDILVLNSSMPYWQNSELMWSPSSQSFLDLSFTEVGNCTGDAYTRAAVYMYFYNLSTSEWMFQVVRYREIQKGEKVNFHIDLHDMRGMWISPSISFDNSQAGSCFKLRIDRLEIHQRTMLFPDWAISERDNLKARFLDSSNKGLGLNDHFLAPEDFIGPEKNSIAAKNVGAKSFRIWAMPDVNFSHCYSSDITRCFDSADLNIYDQFFESLLDRGVPLVALLTTPNFKEIPINLRASFLNNFTYRDSYYIRNGVCTNGTIIGESDFQPLQAYRVAYARFDLTNLYQNKIPDFIFNRYKNGMPAVEISNEVNQQAHVSSCNKTTGAINSAEREFMYGQYNNFTKLYCDRAKAEGIVGIFGSFAGFEDNTREHVSIQTMLSRTNPASIANCSFASIHNYYASLGGVEYPNQQVTDYYSFLNYGFNAIKSFYTTNNLTNKGIILSEFGYGSDVVPAVINYPALINDTANFIAGDPKVLTAQYYLVGARWWMFGLFGWDQWARTAMIDLNYQPIEPYYSQFRDVNSRITGCHVIGNSVWNDGDSYPFMCINDNQLREYYCGPAWYGSWGPKIVTPRNVNCEFNCVNGACIGELPSEPAVPSRI